MAKKDMSLKELEKLYKKAVPANKQGTPPKTAAAIRNKAKASINKGLPPKNKAAVMKKAKAFAKKAGKKAGGKALGVAGIAMNIANMTAKDREKSNAGARRRAAGIPDA